MTNEDNTKEIDEFLSKALIKHEEDILVGWVISYEVMTHDGGRAAGFIYEYNDMSPWRATGLLDWAKTAILARIWNPE